MTRRLDAIKSSEVTPSRPKTLLAAVGGYRRTRTQPALHVPADRGEEGREVWTPRLIGYKVAPMTRHPSRFNIVVRMISIWAVLLWAGTAQAVGPPGSEGWAPPGAGTDGKDWVRMNDGSWLAGEMKAIDDGDVYFETGDLDDLKLDFGDIKGLRSPNINTYRFEGKKIVTGTAVIQGDSMMVDDGSKIHTFPRGELISMIDGTPKEINFWSARASLGFTGRAGNTEQTDLTANIVILRRTALTRFKTEYIGNYSTSGGTKTASNQRVRSALDIYLTRHLFITTPGFELYRDQISNINWRITPSVGIGYDVFSNGWFSWEVGGGVGYQWTQFTDVLVGDDESHDVALLFSTGFDVDITKRIEWDTDYNIQVIATDIDLTSNHLRSVVSFEVWGPLDIDFAFDWDNIIQPRAGVTGIPKSNDYRLTIGVALDFW